MNRSTRNQLDVLPKEVKIYGQTVGIPKVSEFQNFDPKFMKEFRDMTCIFFGARRTGKTTALRHFLSINKSLWDRVYVFSMSADLQKDTFDFAEKDDQFTDFDPEVIGKIIDDQKADVMQKLANKQDHLIKHILIVLDDMISDYRIRTSPVFDSIFSMGRHLRISSIVLTQEIGGKSGVNRICRNNIDLGVCFYPPNENDRELIIEQYLSTQNYKIGEVVLSQITAEPYTAIAFMPRKNMRDLRDFCYVYKAPQSVPKFRIGNGMLGKSYSVPKKGDPVVIRVKKEKREGVKIIID
jgi:hypothetical protein